MSSFVTNFESVYSTKRDVVFSELGKNGEGNSCETCIWKKKPFGTMQMSIHLRLVKDVQKEIFHVRRQESLLVSVSDTSVDLVHLCFKNSP